MRSRVDGVVVRTRTFGVPFLSVYAFACVSVPQDIVVPFVGGVGNLAGLMGLTALLLWSFATSLGYHDPRDYRNPARTGALVFVASYFVAYGALHLRGTSGDSVVASDRWILQVMAWLGIVLAASDMLRTQSDVRRVLRWLSYGGAFCGLVAALQYWMNIDLATWFRSVPGLESGVVTGITERGALSRVAGTTAHPIELGVIAAMLLPIAVFVAVRDIDVTKSVVRRWLPVALIGISIPVSISRSGVLSLVVVLGVLLVLLPARQRLGLLLATPVALVAVFVTARGVLRTIANYTAMGDSDPSIQGRLSDLPILERLVEASPLVGRGPGGVDSGSLVTIFDNQYFSTLVELGFVGLIGLLAYVLVPVLTALDARRRATDPETQEMATALTASLMAVLAGFAAFDGLYFLTLGAVLALIVGITGAVFRLAVVRPETPPVRAAGAPTLPAGTR